MITAAEVGRSALSNTAMLDAVRDKSPIAFRQALRRFDQAVPGLLRLVPQAELSTVIEGDYRAMEGMTLGETPGFQWMMEQIEYPEAAVNGTGLTGESGTSP